MNAVQLLTCPLCGHRFDAAGHVACNSCPLQRGCQMVCCPECGYQTVDPHKSLFARLAQTLFNSFRLPGSASRHAKVGLTLADVPPGWMARLVGFTDRISPDRQARLQAYGLIPNYWVRVVQHSPVTVIRLDNTELALEPELAGEIQVQSIKEGLEDENSQ